MTMTQKRWFEIPILLSIVWIVQALELSILHLPYYLGTPQLLTLLIAYVSFNRGWTTVVLLAFILSFLGSSNAGYATGLFIAAHVWSALGTKTVVSALTLEGRPAFVLLVIGYNLFLKALTWTLLRFAEASPTLPLFVAQFFTQTLLMALVAWIAYPFFLKWDEFFMHALEDEGRGQQTFIR